MLPSRIYIIKALLSQLTTCQRQIFASSTFVECGLASSTGMVNACINEYVLSAHVVLVVEVVASEHVLVVLLLVLINVDTVIKFTLIFLNRLDDLVVPLLSHT